MLAGIGLVSPVAAKGGGPEAERVIAAVSQQLGKPYRWGSTGPNSFDCSGLVYRAFRQAKLARKIGGFNTAHGYFYSFRKKGKTSRSNPRPGDIVVWNNGGHVGIYVGQRQGGERAPERRQASQGRRPEHQVHHLHPPRA